MPPLLPSTASLLLARTAEQQRTGRLPSLVTGVVRDGGLAWSTVRGGLGRPAGHEPTDVQYRLGSITKSVTAVAVMRLRDEGLVHLDDPVGQHLPEVPFAERTIGQLLGHAAGLRAEAPTEWWERTPGLSWPELAARLRGEVDAPLGAARHFHYSNLGFGVLGEVVARLRRRPWIDVVTDEVLVPLGMTRTTPRPSGAAAQGYAVHPWADVVQPEPEHDAGALAPAGQLWSTLADLARFAWFLIDGDDAVLAGDTLEEMTRPYGDEGYGIGLQVFREGGATRLGHGGSMPGFLADVVVERDRRTGVVLLTNGTTGLDAGFVDDLLAIVADHEPAVGAEWTPATSCDPEALALVGAWYWGVAPYSLTLRADGTLSLEGIGARRRASRFAPAGDGTWRGLDGYHRGETLAVVRDSTSAVVALDLGSFIFSRTPYDAAAPQPGGTDPAGWQPHGS